nr:tetratricopeptide repeat protein [Lachnospiraceae bacterium]
MIQKKTITTLLACACLGMGLVLGGCAKENTKIEEGMAAIEKLDYNAALPLFEQAIVEKEDMELAYRGQGLCYLGLTDYAQAIESFKKALSNAGMFVTDTEIDINYYLAMAYYKSGDNASALETLDAIAGMREKQEEVYLLRGMVRMENGDYENAVSDLDSALAKSKGDTAMTIRIYQVYADNGHAEEGKMYLSSALNNHLDSMDDYEKGTVYYYMEDYENAKSFLEKAKSDSKKGGKEIMLMLGKTYEQLGDSNYAASIYKQYLEKQGPDPAIYNQLGLCKLDAGEYEEALNAFNSGLAMEENSEYIQQLRFNQIVAYEYLGDFEKASALMNGYLDSYPDDAAAVREYEFLKTR